MSNSAFYFAHKLKKKFDCVRSLWNNFCTHGSIRLTRFIQHLSAHCLFQPEWINLSLINHLVQNVKNSDLHSHSLNSFVFLKLIVTNLEWWIKPECRELTLLCLWTNISYWLFSCFLWFRCRARQREHVRISNLTLKSDPINTLSPLIKSCRAVCVLCDLIFIVKGTLECCVFVPEWTGRWSSLPLLPYCCLNTCWIMAVLR